MHGRTHLEKERHGDNRSEKINIRYRRSQSATARVAGDCIVLNPASDTRFRLLALVDQIGDPLPSDVLHSSNSLGQEMPAIASHQSACCEHHFCPGLVARPHVLERVGNVHSSPQAAVRRASRKNEGEIEMEPAQCPACSRGDHQRHQYDYLEEGCVRICHCRKCEPARPAVSREDKQLSRL